MTISSTRTSDRFSRLAGTAMAAPKKRAEMNEAFILKIFWLLCTGFLVYVLVVQERGSCQTMQSERGIGRRYDDSKVLKSWEEILSQLQARTKSD